MKASIKNIELFKEIYNPNLTLEENRKNLNNSGLDLTTMTILRWVNKYIKFNEEISVKVPVELYEEVKKMIETYKK